jgi:hypothetical protein
MMSQILALALVASLFDAGQYQQPSSATPAVFGTWLLLDHQGDDDELRPPLRLTISGDGDGIAVTQFGLGTEQATGLLSLIPVETSYPYRRGVNATTRRAHWSGDALVTGSLDGRQTMTYRVDRRGILVVQTRLSDSDPAPRVSHYVRDDPSPKQTHCRIVRDCSCGFLYGRSTAATCLAIQL